VVARERGRARLTGGDGLTATEGGARARERPGAGRAASGGGEARGARERGEKVGPDSAHPTGIFLFLFLFLFLLSPFSFEQILSYIFLGVKKKLYVRCY
jgi:hypothetical protein